jgi:hypothetical protein
MRDNYQETDMMGYHTREALHRVTHERADFADAGDLLIGMLSGLGIFVMACLAIAGVWL